MNVLLNGTETPLPDDATLATALEHLELPHRGVAVALDREVVPRGEWDATPLTDGATVEVVHAVQGG
jgi:sulfur carrier protein